MVLLDLDIPRMSGWEAFKEIHAIDSNVPVILSIGYDVLDTSLNVEGLAGILKKPFRMVEFHAALQRAMTHRSSSVNRSGYSLQCVAQSGGSSDCVFKS